MSENPSSLPEQQLPNEDSDTSKRWWGFTFIIGATITGWTIVLAGIVLGFIGTAFGVEEPGFWMAGAMYLFGVIFRVFLQWASLPLVFAGWLGSVLFKWDADKMEERFLSIIRAFWIPHGLFFGLLWGLQGDGMFTAATIGLGLLVGVIFLILDWKGMSLQFD